MDNHTQYLGFAGVDLAPEVQPLRRQSSRMRPYMLFRPVIERY